MTTCLHICFFSGNRPPEELDNKRSSTLRGELDSSTPRVFIVEPRDCGGGASGEDYQGIGKYSPSASLSRAYLPPQQGGPWALGQPLWFDSVCLAHWVGSHGTQRRKVAPQTEGDIPIGGRVYSREEGSAEGRPPPWPPYNPLGGSSS